MATSVRHEMIVIRCKPCNESKNDWTVDESLLKPENNQSLNYKMVGKNATHSEFFTSISDWVTDTLNGYSVVIVTYGLTCSGKTYTVFGSPGQTRTNPSARGVIVRCMEQMISKLQQQESTTIAQIKGSFYHLSCDGHVSDLVDAKKRNLQVKEKEDGQSYSVIDVTEQTLTSVQDVVRLVEKSLLMRNATGIIRKEKNANQHSTSSDNNPLKEYKAHSSHAVFQYNIEICSNDKQKTVTTSTLTVIDLAGNSIESFHKTSICEDQGIQSLHDTLTALKLNDVHKATESCLSSPLTQLLYTSLFGNSRLIAINTLVTSSSDEILSKKTLEMFMNFQFSQNVSSPTLIPFLSSPLGNNLTKIKESKKQILQELNINTEGSTVEIINKFIKSVKEIESQLLLSSKATPKNILPNKPTLAVPKNSTIPRPTLLPIKPLLKAPGLPSLTPLSPLNLPQRPIQSNTNQKQELSSEVSSSDSEPEKPHDSDSNNVNSPPPLKDIPNILPSSDVYLNSGSNPHPTLLSKDTQQENHTKLPPLPPLKLPNNSKRALVSECSPSPSSPSSSPSSSPTQGKRKIKHRKKKLSTISVFRPAMNRSTIADSSSESDQDKFDPNFLPVKLPVQRQMSLPLRPLNPHQQFSLLRPLSQPYHEVSNDILPKYSNIDPSMSADYQYVPEPSDHVIHLSAMKGANSSQLKTLAMKYGIDYNDEGGRTPLMYAVLGNQIKVSNALINMGAEIDAVDKLHQSALLWAVYQGKSEMIKNLLKHGANVNLTDMQNRSVFHWAMKIPNVTCLKHLCKYASFDIENQSDNEGLAPLHWAVMCEQPQHINIFLSSLPSVKVNCQDYKDRTPLNYAVLLYSPICIKTILECRPEAASFKDIKGRTALHYACAENSVDCIRTLLICKNCDIHASDNLGTAPLHWAAASNQPNIVQLLLRRGANPEQVDKDGMTPLDHAYKRDHQECISIFQKFSARRPSSALSIASQFSIHSPAGPLELDQYGHVTMRRPLSSDNLNQLSAGNSLSSIDRLPADGTSIIEEESHQIQINEDRDNKPLQYNDNRRTSRSNWKRTIRSFLCGTCITSNVVVPQDEEHTL